MLVQTGVREVAPYSPLASQGWPSPANEPGRTLATFSPLLSRQPHTAALFGVQRVLLKPSILQASRVDLVVGWGQKATAKPARSFAVRAGLPYVSAEDGFVRSVGLGVLGDPPCSVVLDDLGIYYDATRPSRLETWLNSPSFSVSDHERGRASHCIDLIRRLRISKYNHAEAPLRLEPTTRRRILVVDQTRGDLSVELGCVPEHGFTTMLEAARDEHPGAELLVKTHPDVLAGKKEGYFDVTTLGRDVRVLGTAVNPIELLEQVDHVYVATSQLGFEALMLDKPVTCFGVPFYAGWGQTDDRARVARRARRRSVVELFIAAYLRYARYANPATGARGQLEDLIEHIAKRRACAGPRSAPS